MPSIESIGNLWAHDTATYTNQELDPYMACLGMLLYKSHRD
jgi:hypothetical protein